MKLVIYLIIKNMLKGYKTYTGIILIILGMSGATKYISVDEANVLIDKIFQIINLSLEVGGVLLALVGAIHKDIRLKKPV